MSDAKCIINPERDCIGLQKAKRLEEDIDNIRKSTDKSIAQVEKRLTDEIHTNRATLDEHTKSLARLETLYSSMEDLPQTIASLDKTIALIGNNLSSMDKNLQEVKEDVSAQSDIIREVRAQSLENKEIISKVDNKSKIDWQEFLTKNFWKIIVGIGSIYAAVQVFISGGA